MSRGIHFLKSKGQALSAREQQPARGSHILKSRGQAMLTEGKHSNQADALTFWKAEDRQCQLEKGIVTKQRH